VVGVVNCISLNNGNKLSPEVICLGEFIASNQHVTLFLRTGQTLRSHAAPNNCQLQGSLQ
jgi:hypothetical protein